MAVYYTIQCSFGSFRSFAFSAVEWYLESTEGLTLPEVKKNFVSPSLTVFISYCCCNKLSQT